MLTTFLARVVLLFYPIEYREHVGEQIIADLEMDPSNTPANLFNLFGCAIGMRFESYASDFSYALRRLRAAPVFAALIALTFALGIGANVAVFSVLNEVVLRPLPFPNASQLALVYFHDPAGGMVSATSISDGQDLLAHSKTLTEVATAKPRFSTLLVGSSAYLLSGLDVTPGYFSMLGIRMQVGGMPKATDSQGTGQEIVISDRLWHERFAANLGLVGQTITLGGARSRVVGVMAPSQLFVDPTAGLIENKDFLDLLPQNLSPKERAMRTAGSLALIAKHITWSQANADLKLVSSRLQRLYPQDDAGVAFSVQSLRDSATHGASSNVWIIFTVVAAILLIACANVGNLLAARWASRDRELVTRLALGAGLRRIAQQLLIETGVLAVLGAAMGVAVAVVALRALQPTLDEVLPFPAAVSIDRAALLYAFGVVLVSTVLAGLSPIISLRLGHLSSALKAGGRQGDSSRGSRLRSALQVTQIALALAVLTMSALMLRNFIALVNAPLGVRAAGVVVTQDVDLSQGIATNPANPGPGMQAAAVTGHRLLERLQALPGVQSAALAMDYPLDGVTFRISTPIYGRRYGRGNIPLSVANQVTPGYFRTIGLPLLHGRDFTNSDTATSAAVAIVNQAFVDTYLQGVAPIGTRITLPTGVAASIVGVVANERDSLLTPPGPEFYGPTQQFPTPMEAAVIYAPSVAAETIEHEVQAAFVETMPLSQAPHAYTINDRLLDQIKPQLYGTILFGILAAIALLLSLAGIAGVVAFSVNQRTLEFGIRMALGATATKILYDVLRRSIVTTSIGIAIGLAIAAYGAHSIADQLSLVSAFDPAVFAFVVILILVSGIAASLMAAARATRVQPAEALRHE